MKNKYFDYFVSLVKVEDYYFYFFEGKSGGL